MRAIVTGGAGFIGSRLVDRIHAEGGNCLVIDDFSTHTGSPRWPKPYPKGSAFYNANVADVTIPKEWWEVDAVFHLAGKLGPVGVLYHKGSIAYDTIVAASQSGRWASKSNVPLIFMSTSEVYGSPDEANSEDTPKVFRQFTARSEYAVSKLAAENMLVNRPGLDVRVIRPFNVTGPGQRADGGFVLPRFAQQALNDDALTVYQPGTQRRSFTHVDDVIDGMMLALTRGVPNEVYNIGNDWNTRTIIEIAEMVIDIVGRGRVEVVDPRVLHGKHFFEAPEKIPNADKARRELGFSPSRPIEQIVAEVVGEYNVSSGSGHTHTQ